MWLIDIFSTVTNLILAVPKLLWLVTYLLYSHVHQEGFVSVSQSFQDEYDYIIVGSGSAGSTLAARLSENSNISVLVLEAGGQPTTASEVPLFALTLIETNLDWQYKSVPQKHSCLGLIDRACPFPRGKVFGGSSTMNFLVYVRGNPLDYDDWASLGLLGWSWKGILPYFLKQEDQTDPSYLDQPEYQSRGGPLTIETVPYEAPVAKAFLEAGKLKGYPTIKLNLDKYVGFAQPQGFTRHGYRCSAAKAYLSGASSRRNVDVLEHAFVTKVIFDSQRTAKAVRFEYAGKTSEVKVRKEIIISAGAINSPQLLMLSGVGPKTHLESLGIPVVADRVGVGENLVDHPTVNGLHFTVDKDKSVNVITLANQFPEYQQERKGAFRMLGGVNALGFVKTPSANQSENRANIQFNLVIAAPSSDFFSLLKMDFNLEVILKYFTPLLLQESYSYLPALLNPKSRGTIRLKSANAHDYPLIDPHFLEHPYDLASLAEALIMAYELGNSPPMKKIGSQAFQTVLPGCEGFPLYSYKYMECFAKTLTFPLYHPMGTCKMGTHEDLKAVVDQDLKVIGVRNLRVVDASIFPVPISGNINAPTIAVAEKAADLIKNDS